MKHIPKKEFMTQLYTIENTEDLGLSEVENFIEETIENHPMNTFNGEWIKKFEKVEISFATFGKDKDDCRGGDYAVLDVDRDLLEQLKGSSILSKYQIDYTIISDESRGDLLIRFLLTDKY